MVLRKRIPFPGVEFLEEVTPPPMPDAGYARYVRHLTLVLAKETSTETMVLRAHLLCEELLRNLLRRFAPRPDALKDTRLTFNQILRIAQAFTPVGNVPKLCHDLELLNRIRNALAHEIEPQNVQQPIKELVREAMTYTAGVSKKPTKQVLLRMALSVVIGQLHAIGEYIDAVGRAKAEKMSVRGRKGAQARWHKIKQ